MNAPVSILDAGLFSIGSHNYNYCLAICAELRGRGHLVDLYGYCDADPRVVAATGATPHFQHLLWNRIDAETPFDEELNWRVLNAAFQADLERLGTRITGPDRIVLTPNVLQHQIAGLAQWFRAIPESEKPHLLINLMFFPRWTAWADQAVRGAEFYLRAVDDIRPWLGGHIHLCAENHDIAEFYRSLLGADVAITPVPIEQPVRLPRSTGPRPTRFGFLGYAKNEKGFFLLPEAFRGLRRRNGASRLLVQIHHHGAEPATIAADHALGAMENVEIVRGSIEKAFYYALLDTCDVIVIPYDPMHYSTRGSGILSEAVAYGKPVIASSGTWAGHALQRGECAGVVCEFNAPSLQSAMADAVGRLSQLNAQAQARALPWLSRNSVSVYCDAVERLAGEPPSPPVASKASAASLANAFPNLASTPSAPPRWRDPFGQDEAGFDWLADGSARLVGSLGRLCFLAPPGKTGAIELCAIGQDRDRGGTASVALNGAPLGEIAFGPDERRFLLRVSAGQSSFSAPCRLEFQLKDDAPALVITSIRAATNFLGIARRR